MTKIPSGEHMRSLHVSMPEFFLTVFSVVSHQGTEVGTPRSQKGHTLGIVCSVGSVLGDISDLCMHDSYSSFICICMGSHDIIYSGHYNKSFLLARLLNANCINDMYFINIFIIQPM